MKQKSKNKHAYHLCAGYDKSIPKISIKLNEFNHLTKWKDSLNPGDRHFWRERYYSWDLCLQCSELHFDSPTYEQASLELERYRFNKAVEKVLK